MSKRRTRHSWLIVPMSKSEALDHAMKSGADVIVLDLVEFVADKDKAAARGKAHSAIEEMSRSGAQVFVQTEPGSLDTDLRAAVHPGLSGIVISRAESAADIQSAAMMLDTLEGERGMQRGAVEIVAAVETAKGNLAAYDIARGSPRVTGVTLGRADLIMDLRPEPSQEIHMMPYLMQRLVIIAGAAGVAPIGAWWRAPDRGLLATAKNTYEAAHRGRAIGFKGAMCLRPDQVESLNRAFA